MLSHDLVSFNNVLSDCHTFCLRHPLGFLFIDFPWPWRASGVDFLLCASLSLSLRGRGFPSDLNFRLVHCNHCCLSIFSILLEEPTDNTFHVLFHFDNCSFHPENRLQSDDNCKHLRIDLWLFLGILRKRNEIDV